MIGKEIILLIFSVPNNHLSNKLKIIFFNRVSNFTHIISFILISTYFFGK